MRFAIVNESTDPAVTGAILELIAGAIERQLYEHFAPFWESIGAPVRVYEDISKVPADTALVVILDDSAQAGYLGYHNVTPDGRSYARVFWVPIRGAGGTLTSGSSSLSVTLSHEILEIIADPYITFWAANPDTGILHALEACDACESESYVVDGISVSNFVGPRFFRKGVGPYDWMGHQGLGGGITAPFKTAPGGYQILAASMANITSVFADGYPDWKKRTKDFTAARTLKRLDQADIIVEEEEPI